MLKQLLAATTFSLVTIYFSAATNVSAKYDDGGISAAYIQAIGDSSRADFNANSTYDYADASLLHAEAETNRTNAEAKVLPINYTTSTPLTNCSDYHDEKRTSCGDDINAEFGCGIYCNRRCSSIGQEPQICTQLCKNNACDCKEGFYLDDNTGKCVLPEDCTSICGTYEVYSDCVQSHCGPRDCSQLNTARTCPFINTELCIEGCVCKDNFIRSYKGPCIPKNKCPPVCADNEIYVDCIEDDCIAVECSQLGFPLECSNSNLTCLGDGCVCIDNYLRADNGTCIPAKSCPSCGGDINAEYGCGINCNQHCSNIGQKETEFCMALCIDNGCDCKAGFYLDDNTGKCVLPKDCTMTCAKNEIYTNCIESEHCVVNCSQLELPLECTHLALDYCTVGCVCEDGYLRNDNGTCIPTTACPSSPQSKIERSLDEFRRGNLVFTSELLYQLAKSKPGISFVASALSAMIPFAQLSLYAVGLTLEQLLTLINLKNKHQIKQSFPVLLKNFQNQETVVSEVANKFYGNINYTLSDMFKRDVQSVFNSEAENIDFNDTFQTTTFINNWVANKTNHLIENLILSNTLNASSELICMNALYFLGNWRLQFNPKKTKNRDFYITSNNTKSVPTMYQQATFNYTEDSNLNAQIIELDYTGEKFSCVIWLPKKMNGLMGMVEKLRDPDIFYNSINSFRSEIVKVYLPKMDIATDIDLVDVLEKVNVTEMFNPNSGELRGILNSDVPLFVSGAIQKVRIKVDEIGTEAAVATAGTVTTLSLPNQPSLIQDFNANHPYVFCIKFQTTLVFCGVYN